MRECIKLIVGLGNPGQQYRATRHNVGFWAVESFAAMQRVKFKKENKFKGLVSNAIVKDHKCLLLMPTTFMNLSGESVQSIAQFYKVSPETILVIHDELDFAPGVVRLKYGGGANGHNGIQDITQKLGSDGFWRARLGIGKPVTKEQGSNYVTSVPLLLERKQIDSAIARLIDVFPLLIEGDYDAAYSLLSSPK